MEIDLGSKVKHREKECVGFEKARRQGAEANPKDASAVDLISTGYLALIPIPTPYRQPRCKVKYGLDQPSREPGQASSSYRRHNRALESWAIPAVPILDCSLFHSRRSVLAAAELTVDPARSMDWSMRNGILHTHTAGRSLSWGSSVLE